MTHLWVRAEERPDEARTGLTPEGAAALIGAGFRVTIEESRQRALPLAPYLAAGCIAMPEGSWRQAPDDAVIFGLKELPEEGFALRHTHILFGHAYKGQAAGQRLLARFAAGGGTLLDLESLVDETGRRVAAFGYWAGFAGAAVSLLAHAAQAGGGICPPVTRYAGRGQMVEAVRAALGGRMPRVLIIGALGRVGRGAGDLCAELALEVTRWDIAETAHGGPFPEVLAHEVFLNCILAAPGCPVFVPASALDAPRALRIIGDIACDPGSAFSPVPVYDRATDWAAPVVRVAQDPVLDVMAIDNLPSLLPAEASQDFAAQLLPHLLALSDPANPVWHRARAMFTAHLPGAGR
jgi:saccharopine dehydrogenase (NAD+, L-lysine-forming)